MSIYNNYVPIIMVLALMFVGVLLFILRRHILRQKIQFLVCIAVFIPILIICIISTHGESTYIEADNLPNKDSFSLTPIIIGQLLEDESFIDKIDDARIALFDLAFLDGDFSNLKFTVVIPTGYGYREDVYQINKSGEVFVSKAPLINYMLVEHSIPLWHLKQVLELYNLSALTSFKHDMNDVTNISYGGIIDSRNIAPNDEDILLGDYFISDAILGFLRITEKQREYRCYFEF